jgi:hypothetical protein
MSQNRTQMRGCPVNSRGNHIGMGGYEEKKEFYALATSQKVPSLSFRGKPESSLLEFFQNSKQLDSVFHRSDDLLTGHHV